LVTGEGSVAAGIRRIEAVTGRGALQRIRTRLHRLESAAERLGATPESVPDRIEMLIGEKDRLLKELGASKTLTAQAALDALTPTMVGDIPVMTALLPEADADTLRSLVDAWTTSKRRRSWHPSPTASR
jgi:alanyl-tRNA synthetase